MKKIYTVFELKPSYSSGHMDLIRNEIILVKRRSFDKEHEAEGYIEDEIDLGDTKTDFVIIPVYSKH